MSLPAPFRNGELETLLAESGVVLRIERRALPPGDPRLYRDQTAFGEVLISAGKSIEAGAVLRGTLEAQRKILGSEHPDVAATLSNLAMADYQQGRYAEAERLDREVLALVRTHYGPSHWMAPMILGNLATALQSQKKVTQAIPYLEEALEVRRHSLGAGHPLVAQALLLLAGAHRELAQYPAQKRYREAEPLLRQALEIRRRGLAADHPEVSEAKISLADCLVELGHAAEAASLLREADATFSGQYGPHDSRGRRARELLAKLEPRR